MNSEEPQRRKRGRPRVYDQKTTERVILNYRDQVIQKNEFNENVVASTQDPIWKKISDELDNGRTPRAIFTLVTNDEDGIRSMLDSKYVKKCPMNDIPYINEESSQKAPVLDDTLDGSKEFDFSFSVSEPATNYLALIKDHVSTQINRRTGVENTRCRKRAIPGRWQDYFMDKVWLNTKGTHGYSFKYPTINDDDSCYIFGRCGCDAAVDCHITVKDNVMIMQCNGTKGSPGKSCTLRPVRGPKRLEWGDQLISAVSSKKFQGDLAGKIMEVGDPWAPTIPNLAVLRQIRHEAIVRQYLDPDPINSLEILQKKRENGEITLINSDPVMVCYSTTSQQELYRQMIQKGHLSLCVDSTGSLLHPIIRADKSTSGPLFLYQMVVRTTDFQTSLAQMISERGNTRDILVWFNSFLAHSRLPSPSEVVMDGAPALQNAAIRAFTPFSTRNEYSNSFHSSSNGSCWIRSDGAHFLKTFVDLLKKVVRWDIARFYKTAIGKLIICCDLQEAETIIRSLLTCALSEKMGSNFDNTESAANQEIRKLKTLFTTNSFDCDTIYREKDEGDEAGGDNEDSERTNDKPSGADDPEEDSARPLWFEWVDEVKESVEEKIRLAPGSEPSLYYAPQFSAKLVTDIAHLPMWSCIFLKQFEFGRVPASSSAVENEFGQIKHLLMKGQPRCRIDSFCQLQMDYYDKCLLLINGSEKRTRGKAPGGDSKSGSEDTTHENRHFDSQNRADAPENDVHTNEPTPDSDGAEMYDVPESRKPSSKDYYEPRTPRPATESSDDQCPICANGHLPTGLHKCSCGKAVHIHDKCSVSLGDDEGCGERRKCRECFTKENAENGTSSSYRPPSPLAQFRGHYFKKTHPSHHFEPQQSVDTLPLLRCGDDLSLQAVSRNGNKYSMKSTDAFDAFFHLVLATALDSSAFRDGPLAQFKEDNDFLALIDKTLIASSMHTGIYGGRCDILRQHFQDKQTGLPESKCFIVNCESSAATICEKMFADIPTFTRTNSCENDCSAGEQEFIYADVLIEKLLNNPKSIESVISASSNENGSTCNISECDAALKSKIVLVSNFIFLDIQLPQDKAQILLKNIPRELESSTLSTILHLRGVIHYQSPQISRVRAGNKFKKTAELRGAYTVYCLRNHKWYHYDKKKSPANKNQKVCPNLIFYSE